MYNWDNINCLFQLQNNQKHYNLSYHIICTQNANIYPVTDIKMEH